MLAGSAAGSCCMPRLLLLGIPKAVGVHQRHASPQACCILPTPTPCLALTGFYHPGLSLSLFLSPSFAVRIFDLRSSELVGSTQHTRSRLAGAQGVAQRWAGGLWQPAKRLRAMCMHREGACGSSFGAHPPNQRTTTIWEFISLTFSSSLPRVIARHGGRAGRHPAPAGAGLPLR